MSAKSGPRLISIIAAGCIVCIGALAGAVYLTSFSESEQSINWNVTLIGTGEERVLTFGEVKALPSVEGYGGFFTTVGVINGPYRCKGVPVEELLTLIGGFDASNTLWISASDGYLMTFSYDQVEGNFRTYDPTTFKEIPHGELKLILMYEQNGKPLSDYDGKPLRIAIVSPDNTPLTEGHNWVKWVTKLEVRTLAGI
jgi:hypothetical protein